MTQNCSARVQKWSKILLKWYVWVYLPLSKGSRVVRQGVGWYKINIWAKFHYWGLVKNGQKRPKVRVACIVKFAVLRS